MMRANEIEILYVEDNPDDAELTLTALRRSNLANHIYLARDGVEALDFLFCRGAQAGRDPNVPKLVLLDLKLPKIDGLEVLRIIRSDARTEFVPVVMLTASREQRDLIESYKLGVNSYIQKPVDFENFQVLVKQLGLYWIVVNQCVSSDDYQAAAGGEG